MGHHNFKDEALIKRWRARQKMNGMSGKFKDENKQNNCQKLFSFATRSYVFFQSYGVHKNMNVENMIKKLQKVAREKETKKKKHRWRQEEEVKVLRKKK